MAYDVKEYMRQKQKERLESFKPLLKLIAKDVAGTITEEESKVLSTYEVKK